MSSVYIYDSVLVNKLPKECRECSICPKKQFLLLGKTVKVLR